MEQKRFVKVGLTIDHFKAYVPLIVKELNDYLNSSPTLSVFQTGRTDSWGSFHTFKALSQITIFTASRTLQGQEVRDGLDSSVADLYHDLDAGFTPINFLFPNLPLPSYWRRDRAHKKMSDFYVNVIQKRKEDGGSEVSDAFYGAKSIADDCVV